MARPNWQCPSEWSEWSEWLAVIDDDEQDVRLRLGRHARMACHAEQPGCDDHSGKGACDHVRTNTRDVKDKARCL